MCDVSASKCIHHRRKAIPETTVNVWRSHPIYNDSWEQDIKLIVVMGVAESCVGVPIDVQSMRSFRF